MRFLTPAMMTVVLLLVVAGLVVAYVVKSLFAAEPVARVEPRLYPMAVADLEPGTVITEAHLAQAPYSGEPFKTYARSNTVLVGRVVKEKIQAATPIDTTRLYAPGERPPVVIAVGMRAVSIDLGDGAAVVDGLVKAGEYVDVHFTPSVSDARFRGGLTMTLFKGVKVLTVNRSRGLGAATRGSNTITLELTPEQANILLLAQQKGGINIAYTPDGVGNGGVAVAEEDRAFFEEILGLAPVPEPKKPITTEHYVNGGRSIMAFNDDGTPWGGYGGGYNGGWGAGDGTRPAPHQFGGHEPTGGWGGNGGNGGWGGNGGGYFRGIDANGAQNLPGANGNPNAGQNGGVQLIPGQNGGNNGGFGRGGAGAGRGEGGGGGGFRFDGI